MKFRPSGRIHHRIQQGLLILALFCAMLFAAAPVAMAGFGPGQYKAGYTYGNGIFFAPYRFSVHAEPDEKSPVVESLRWSHGGSLMSALNQTPKRPDNVFFCFYPELDVAMMAVVGDTDTGWVEVIYDQAEKRTGWVKLLRGSEVSATGASQPASTQADMASLAKSMPPHMGVYQAWVDFMKLNAKAHGIYWLGGVSQYHRSIRMSDDDKAKMIPMTIVRDLKVKHLRGNWLLVEVLDFERNTPIGWVRWRDNDGNLMVFPNLTEDKGPIITTVY